MEISGIIDYNIVLLLFIFTLIIGRIVVRRMKSMQLKLLVLLALFTVFVYSGYGIAYKEVDNKYCYYYFLYIICLLIPFMVYGRKNIDKIKDTPLDSYLIKHNKFLLSCTIIYLVCMFVPLVYPSFKLFDVFTKGFNGLIGFYDLRVEYKSNALIGVIDTLRVFVQPFFIAYITSLQVKGNNRNALILFVSTILLDYMRYAYLSRYQIVIYALLIFLLAFSVKGYSFNLRIKQIFLVICAGFAAIPLLLSYTYIRQGNLYEGSHAFSDMMSMLIDSEAYYPTYYDHLLKSPMLANQTPMVFILWLICLPIPSFIWPSKPTFQSDAFTYSLTGLHYGDYGYSSSLPSVMGESFMFFGADFFWLHALIIGLVMVLIMNYLSKHKTMTFYSVYLAVYVLTLGRAGATSYMSTIINGSLAVFLLDFYVRKIKR